MSNEELKNKISEALCKIAKLFEQAFTELLKDQQSQAAILIRLNKAVSEFKWLQETLKKNEVEIDVKINHIETTIFVKDMGRETKLKLSHHDNKWLKSLKISPPNKEE